jgi:hypothetical protein
MTGHPLDAPTGDAMPQTATREYVRRVRIACDDVHDEPHNPSARASLVKMLIEDSPCGPAPQQPR